MDDLCVVDQRGGIAESRHLVSLAIAGDRADLLASAGSLGEPVFWRSTAKPFQLWPLVERGGLQRFGLSSRHVALACASHNGAAIHREVAAEWLRAAGLDETDLACGGHPSLSPAVAESMIREGRTVTPLGSNCSGKHSAMLALARLEGWPTEGYQNREHPVQQAIADSIARWSGVSVENQIWGVDGCTAAAVATPLSGLARAWANLATGDDPALGVIRQAMLAHPELLAGADRLDTVLMQAWPGRLILKVGAEGVFAAALPGLGIGIALKVQDGDSAASMVAIVGVLRQVVARYAPDDAWPLDAVARWHDPEIVNTRGEATGSSVLQGTIRFT
ncbi:MAG TPA: asparaginase [Gemmatimonadales bacterium]|nr:asparaginase [Gemmatimonadales bacterium]